MATTDTRPGFRLPWSSERPETETGDAPSKDAGPASDDATAAAPSTDAVAQDEPVTAEAEAVVADPTDASSPDPVLDADASTPVAAEPAPEPVAAPTPAAPAARAKPNKFLADLTRAMRATAETARDETMDRFAADAKAATERVHAAAADEATELRRLADEDVQGIRDWSKAEIAAIREETERRISGRKSDLEHELEGHAAVVEGRIERVSAFVASFEAEMTGFYERLFAEEDPTRFAAMAEQLPEAPSLDLAELDAAAATAKVAAPEPEPVVEAVAEPVADAVAEPETADQTAEIDPAAATADPTATDDTAPAEANAETAALTGPDASTTAEAVAPTPAVDPRVAALGLAPDFAAAEAEAALSADDAEADATPAAPEEEIPTIADEVLAARLAGLVPDENAASNPLSTTRVVVTGLISVASIAGFKRSIGRLQGVTSVGVSSGPDGEFVFSVHHLPTVDLAAAVTGMAGYSAKVTGTADGELTVNARDPEAHD